MNEQEWLQWRRKGIGASDAPIIMGASPWTTPYQLWREKVFGEGLSQENEATLHGKKYEEAALQWLENETGEFFFPQIRMEHPILTWMRATLDGRALDGTICEIKCPYNLKNHEEVKKTRRIPEKYIWQLYHQLEVSGEKEIIFLSYNYLNPEDSIALTLGSCQEKMDQLIEAEKQFQTYVENRTSPPWTEKDYEWEKNRANWKEAFPLAIA